MATSPVLNLDTDEETTVAIDAVRYPLRSINDLSLSQFKLLERHSPRIGELLLTFDELDDAGVAELSQLLAIITRMAVDAPEMVIDKLGDVSRVQVYRVFTELLSPRLLRARAEVEGSVSAGMKPSPGSNASTEATPRPGRRKSRSVSSART